MKFMYCTRSYGFLGNFYLRFLNRYTARVFESLRTGCVNLKGKEVENLLDEVRIMDSWKICLAFDLSELK